MRDWLLGDYPRCRVSLVPPSEYRSIGRGHQTLLKVFVSSDRPWDVLGGHGFGDGVGLFAVEELGNGNLEPMSARAIATVKGRLERPYLNVPLRSLQKRNRILYLLIRDSNVLLERFLLARRQLSDVVARVGHGVQLSARLTSPDVEEEKI